MSASADSVSFEFRAEGSVGTLYKSEKSDDFVIWGPASVEVVDKEDDRIKASALEDALPQLLKRSTLSYEHSDQIVGEILEGFQTEEPVTVKIGDEQVQREEFPTDVLKNEIDRPALFVAGKVYGDTRKSQEVRDAIENGDIRSFSISGEAITSKMAVEDGRPITDIEKLDLSAVTLCREGMNQKAKFGVVKKMDPSEGPDATALDPDTATAVLKSRTMSNGDNDDPLTKSGMEELLDKHTPDGDIATKEDVKSIAREQAEEVFKENATNTKDEKEGTADRPDGDDSSPTEQDQDYEGDNPDETASDPDKVEEKSMDAETLKSAMKKILPDDQFKAVEPLIEEKADDIGEEEDPLAEPEEDEGLPSPPEEEEEEPMLDEEEEEEPQLDLIEEKAKSLGLDPQTLTQEQRERIAQADLSKLNKAQGVGAPSGNDTSPQQGGQMSEDDLAKADNNTLSGSNFFGDDGEVKL